jgi:hypothetical protein
MTASNIIIRKVTTKADRKAFVDLPYRLYADNPNWVPPLKDDVYFLISETKNPWFEHGEAQLFLAERGGKIVGRISAHIDHLALKQPPEQGMGPGTGFWGLFEAEDAETAGLLIKTAEDWLRAQGMTKLLGPVSLCMWDEPGLLVTGHDHPSTFMMGYHSDAYEAWVDAAGYVGKEDLYTYVIPIDVPFPDLVNRIVAMGEKSPRIVIRCVERKNFDKEAALIMEILNDAWSDNWGFVPFTDKEIEVAGKKLKPIVREDLIRIAEVDGEPVAFMMTIPNMNEKLITYGGSLFPFNWAKLLWWLRNPKCETMRVPLMGVKKKHQSTRLASQLAMMMVDLIRRDAVSKYGSTRGEFGWVLGSNGPMNSVGEAINGKINKIYRIYEKQL